MDKDEIIGLLCLLFFGGPIIASVIWFVFLPVTVSTAAAKTYIESRVKACGNCHQNMALKLTLCPHCGARFDPSHPEYGSQTPWGGWVPKD